MSHLSKRLVIWTLSGSPFASRSAWVPGCVAHDCHPWACMPRAVKTDPVVSDWGSDCGRRSHRWNSRENRAACMPTLRACWGRVKACARNAFLMDMHQYSCEVHSPACLAFQPKAHRPAKFKHQEALACTQSQKRHDRETINIVACSQAKHEQQVLYSMCWSSFFCDLNVVSNFPE